VHLCEKGVCPQRQKIAATLPCSGSWHDACKVLRVLLSLLLAAPTED